MTKARRAPDNKLLAALPAAEYARLLPMLRRIDLPFNHVLQKQGDPIAQVFFASGGVLSATHQMEDGRLVEIATVGPEGIGNIEAFVAADVAHHDIIVQVPVENGYAEVMDAGVFRREAARPGPFRDIVLRYAHAYMTLIAQCTACNGLHTVNQRCAKWLLMSGDRAHDDSFVLSQQYLAAMLGVRRASVSVIAGQLRRKGLIEYRRGRVIIRNRRGLEKVACECYELIRSTFERIVPAAS